MSKQDCTQACCMGAAAIVMRASFATPSLLAIDAAPDLLVASGWLLC